MNEIQAYQAVYGDLVHCVPHYKKRTKREVAELLTKYNGMLIDRVWNDEASKIRRKELEDYLTPSRKR